jgi:hypothetical protein
MVSMMLQSFYWDERPTFIEPVSKGFLCPCPGHVDRVQNKFSSTQTLQELQGSISPPDCLTPEMKPDTHWTEAWVTPKAGLDVMEKNKFFCSYRDSNSASSSTWLCHSSIHLAVRLNDRSAVLPKASSSQSGIKYFLSQLLLSVLFPKPLHQLNEVNCRTFS